MDLRNQFDPLDPRDPGFVYLSDNDPESAPADGMNVVQAGRHASRLRDHSCHSLCSFYGSSSKNLQDYNNLLRYIKLIVNLLILCYFLFLKILW